MIKRKIKCTKCFDSGKYLSGFCDCKLGMKKQKTSKKTTKKKAKRLNIITLNQKYYNGEKLFQYEKDYMRDWYVKDNDILTSRIVKLRDKDEYDMVHCISCPSVHHYLSDQINACHFIGRANYLYRWDLNNVHGGCKNCNFYHQEQHQQNFTVFMINKYGLTVVENMLQNDMLPNQKPSLEIVMDINKFLKNNYYTYK